MIDVRTNINKLISQYANANSFRSILQALFQLYQDELVSTLYKTESYMHRENADGAWLDFIGRRLDFIRPSVLDLNRKHFGFEPQSSASPSVRRNLGFNVGPMYSINKRYQGRIPLGDEYYANMLASRALCIRSTTSKRDIETVLTTLFDGGGIVHDTINPLSVTLTVTESRLGYVDIVKDHQHKLIPRTAGIAQTIVEN